MSAEPDQTCARSTSSDVVGMRLHDQCPRCRHQVAVHSLQNGCVVCRLEELEVEWRARLDAFTVPGYMREASEQAAEIHAAQMREAGVLPPRDTPKTDGT